VWIFSALEPCSTYSPWHDKTTGENYLRPGDGKRLHYYFYFIAEELGLCYVRVPAWCPFGQPVQRSHRGDPNQTHHGTGLARFQG
jgi:hypothetical protein